MNWKQLAEEILKLPEDRQLDTATVYLNDSDEAHGIMGWGTVGDNSPLDDVLGGVLDDGHFYAVVEA